MSKTAIIIGAGPAGLTAAYELLQQTDIVPIVLEATEDIGGLAKTVNYKGNRLDIGPHRFFSKSDRVMNWWQQILPIEAPNEDIVISYQNKHTTVHPLTGKNRDKDEVMLVLDRQTHIYFDGKLFSYPIKLSKETIKNLGLWRIARIGFSYVKSQMFPRRPEKTLEDFFINRFGKELYLTFFKDYTEKVWGQPTNQISAEWGAQRVKGLSLTKAVKHLLFPPKKNSLGQKDTETSLIEKFLYPKQGPGQMWEAVARRITERGGKVLLGHQVVSIAHKEDKIDYVITTGKNGEEIKWIGDYFISSMPVKDLVSSFAPPVTAPVLEVADKLVYRDFIVVGVLLKDIKLKDRTGRVVRDNWVYIQEKNVKLGRLQVYNNWGGGMVHDRTTYWIGLEYFCNMNDELWVLTDDQMTELALTELVSINLINRADVIDSTVIRVPKAYPSYVGSYDKFDEIRKFIDKFPNLFLVGRNGMHKYNNQDHSMLTAMQVVENIRNGSEEKENIWAINTEQEYHEEQANKK